MKLRLAHWNQLAFYIKNARETGLYYGNRKQFDARHIDIEEWLFAEFEKAQQQVLKENQHERHLA